MNSTVKIIIEGSGKRYIARPTIPCLFFSLLSGPESGKTFSYEGTLAAQAISPHQKNQQIVNCITMCVRNQSGPDSNAFSAMNT